MKSTITYWKKLLYLCGISVFVFSIIMGVVWTLFSRTISNYWLHLRLPTKTTVAIAALKGQGIDVYTLDPVFPVGYELGLDEPNWICRREGDTEISDILELQNLLEQIRPKYIIWRNDKKFDDQTILIIQNLHELKLLDLTNKNVSDSSLVTITNIDSDLYVSLSGTNVSNKSFELIREHRKIK